MCPLYRTLIFTTMQYIRTRPFPSFPDADRIRDVFLQAPDRMLLGSPFLRSVCTYKNIHKFDKGHIQPMVSDRTYSRRLHMSEWAAIHSGNIFWRSSGENQKNRMYYIPEQQRVSFLIWLKQTKTISYIVYQATIDWWSTEYYRVLDDWVSQGRFAGKDQDLMVDIFDRYPNKFLLLRSYGKRGVLVLCTGNMRVYLTK